MEAIRRKLKNWLSDKWNYEILCDVFEGLNKEELNKIASIYAIDTNLSRLEICDKLSKILDAKKNEYQRTLDAQECHNSQDPISGTDIELIDPRDVITVVQNDKKYCFEIEGLYKNVFLNNNSKNPYTNVPFNQEQISFIEKEYEKFKMLKGTKFDIDAYSTDSSLTAMTSQLLNYLPYTTGIKYFIDADRVHINDFIIQLYEYNVLIDTWGVNPEQTDIPVAKDTKLREFKIKLIRQLINYIVQDDYFPVREAWRDIFSQRYLDARLELRREQVRLEAEEGIRNEFIRSIRGNYPLDIVKAIGENISDVNERCYICVAFEHSADIGIVKYLMSRGALLDESLLEDAIKVNRPDLAKLVISNGVSVDFYTSDNESLLLYALKKNMDASVIMAILNAVKVLEERDEIKKRIVDTGNAELIDKVNQL